MANSDDAAVNSAIVELEDEYVAALDAFRANPDDENLAASYKEAKNNLATAVRTARAGRGMAINT